MDIRARLLKAAKNEAGIRLSQVEVVRLVNLFGIRTEESPLQRVSAATGQSIDIHIRWMIRRDMPEVLKIEAGSFEFPWTEEDFIRCLRQRNCIGMVAEHDERVVGFMIYELHKTRLHIVNFAVHPTFRRRGVGTQMANKLIGKLSHQRRPRISLEVSENNLDGQLFWRRMGFRAVSTLKDFYDESDQDAYRFEYRMALQEAD